MNPGCCLFVGVFAPLLFASTPALTQGVDASRTIARRGQPIQEIQTEFKLPPTGDPEFIYRLLGGRIDRQSPWIGVITAQGAVVYRKVEGS